MTIKKEVHEGDSAFPFYLHGERRLEDDYDIDLEPVGKGKFATVFKGVRIKDGIKVAVKAIELRKYSTKDLRAEVVLLSRVG